MATYINNAPFSDKTEPLQVLGTSISIRPFQLLAWVSLTPREVQVLPSDAPKFIAVIDTAHGHNFSIKENWLREWAGLELNQLKLLARVVKIRDARGFEEIRPLHDANLWLHASQPNVPPLFIELDRGITVYSDPPPGSQAASGPPLPLLGTRALRTAELLLQVNYRTMTFSLGDAPES
jgi:hypothetical protein